jgi:hypothetical protein
VENHAEFKDYNSTTTQSDRGELLYDFLDLLRLKASYERVAWNLQPVVLAHEILARRGRAEAAEIWRRVMAERTAELADRHLRALADLSRKYGRRLPTIADRLAERFMRPLAIDRLKALVRPAIEDVRAGRASAAFDALEQEIAEFTETPTGAGLDVPGWLMALEEEVADNEWADRCNQRDDNGPSRIPQAPLSLEEVQQQIQASGDRTCAQE